MSAVHGMALPPVDPSVVDGVLVRLAGVSARAAVARTGLDESTARGWSGSAAGEFLELRARVAGRVDVIADVAAGAAKVMESYAAGVSEAVVRMRAAQRQLEAAIAAHDTAVAAAGASGVGVADLTAELEQTSGRIWRDWEAAREQYVAVGAAATEGLTGLLQLVEGQRAAPLTLRGHVEAGLTSLVQEVVVDGWNGTWSLTGAVVTDRATWQQTWAGLPGGVWHAVTHPEETFKEAVAWEHWADGEWGEAVAGVGTTAVGVAMRRPGVPSKWAKHMADPNAPRPRTQSVDELVARVDLDASEHHDLGHTLRRHVVDDEYLQDRLTNGTLKDDGSRDLHQLAEASRWSSRAVAEESITAILRSNQELVGMWVASGKVKSPAFFGPVDAAAGEVMTRDGDGFAVRPAVRGRVVLRRDGDDIYVFTAYVD